MDLKKAEKIIKETQQFARTILNSLSAHIAIIDERGVVLETNLAWREFARHNEISIRPDTLQVNYLEICDAATGDSAEKSKEVAEGIRQVIRGELDEFVIDYACHSPEQKRWFYMRATRAVGEGPLRVVISHENITALKSAEEQLEEKTRHLEEANFALRAVIRQSNEARKEIEQIVLQNIRESVLPKVTELKHHRGAQSIRHLTEEIEKDLHEIASPFLQRLANIASVLTPQEMKIAMLIKDGKSSKEMAEQLNLSGPTINFHRQNLRKKLGLSGTGSNLRTYLVGLVN
jgi:DNA-binding CsgD family transcriptional regulator